LHKNVWDIRVMHIEKEQPLFNTIPQIKFKIFRENY
jgi:hypothetical protein